MRGGATPYAGRIRIADCPAFAAIRRRYGKRERAMEQPSLLLYRVVDGLVDSFFPSLAALDDGIDELGDAIFWRPTTGSCRRSSR
jgi:Mg2+ and Co2+ transporter CorA